MGDRQKDKASPSLSTPKQSTAGAVPSQGHGAGPSVLHFLLGETLPWRSSEKHFSETSLGSRAVEVNVGDSTSFELSQVLLL